MEKEKVEGKFSVRYIASGPFPPRIDIAANCDGVRVKELRAVRAGDANEIDLGTLAP
jgi:hypothetical protein